MNSVFSSLESLSNPFAQMTEPGKVLASMHRSERLNALASRVFSPLAWLPSTRVGEEEAHHVDADGWPTSQR